MLELVVATSNAHKVEEIAAILAGAGVGVRLLSLAEAGGPFEEPAETGTTFGANARIKAESYASQTGRACLADDSGLEVDALGGRPGVISSHYCTDGREVGMARAERDARNNERLLRELDGLAAAGRSARFVCVMVLAGWGGGHSTRGACEGRIGFAARGAGGFGYDPLFLIGPDHTRTTAELSAAEKNSVSHRGIAARAMAEWLRAGGG